MCGNCRYYSQKWVINVLCWLIISPIEAYICNKNQISTDENLSAMINMQIKSISHCDYMVEEKVENLHLLERKRDFIWNFCYMSSRCETWGWGFEQVTACRSCYIDAHCLYLKCPDTSDVRNWISTLPFYTNLFWFSHVHTGLDAEKRPLIKIENCLFEWNRWHSILPTFIPPPDLKEQGFEIGEYGTHLIFSWI